MEPKVEASRGLQLLEEVLKTKKQTTLAADLGINQATISQIVRRQMLPSRKVALALQTGASIPTSSWDEPPLTEATKAPATEGDAA